MSEDNKRFRSYYYEAGYITDIEDADTGKELSISEVIDSLNSLHDENQKLREQLHHINSDSYDDEEVEDRFQIVNNYYKGLVVIDTHISKIVRDDFIVNIICENNNIYSLVDLLNSQNNEIERLKNKIKEYNG